MDRLLGEDDDYPSSERWKVFIARRHEPGEKTVMGKAYAEGGATLHELTDDLARDPRTIAHLSAKLARSFVTEAPTDEDVAAISAAWVESDGHLPTVHRAVIERAMLSEEPGIFQQPEAWLYQMLRLSGGSLFLGIDQTFYRGRDFDQFQRDQDWLLTELGQSYWVERQPNGYSDQRADWISPEHVERRLRFAQLVFRAGNVAADADALMDRMAVSEATRQLVSSSGSPEDRFILLFCSPEMLEA